MIVTSPLWPQTQAYILAAIPGPAGQNPLNIMTICCDTDYVYCLVPYRLYRYHKIKKAWTEPWPETIQAIAVDTRFVYTDRWILKKTTGIKKTVDYRFAPRHESTSWLIPDYPDLWAGSIGGGCGRLSRMHLSKQTVQNYSLVTMHFDYSDSQISFADSFYAAPDYPIDSYLS
jgi:hypothetical protein